MSKKVIICVDDEEVLLRSLKEEILSIFGYVYQIETVDNPNEALELLLELKENDYEIPLIISDYIMPEMYGDEMLQKVHRLSQGTVTVILSGQATFDGVVNAINEAHLFRYLEKPWSRDELEKVIVDAIRRYDENKVENSQESSPNFQEPISENERQLLKEKIDFLKEIYKTLPEIRADIEVLFQQMRSEEKGESLYTKTMVNIEKILDKVHWKEKNIYKEEKL